MTATQTIRRYAFFPAAALLFGLAFWGGQESRHARASDVIPHLANMQEVERAINTNAPVLFQFDAKWCGYCRALQPHLVKLREQNTLSELHIYKIDVDAAKDIAAEFGVRSLPTMFVVYKGKVAGFRRGGMTEEQLFDWVASVQEEIRNG